MKLAAMLAGLFLCLSAGILAGERHDESVVLIRMSFDRGQWKATPLKILPCGAPSKPNALSRERSVFHVMDQQGKILYRRYITNPRIILVEDPEVHARLLPKIEFTLAVPIVRGATKFQFFEREQDYRSSVYEKEDSSGTASADLHDLITSYLKREHEERASCQIIVPKPEDREKLGQIINTAVSVETITDLIAHDQRLLIEIGLQQDIEPKDLRKIIYRYRDNWTRFHVTEQQVEEFLKRYTDTYRDAVKVQKDNSS